ncbi:hypothetical protein HNY73_007831 [Argiope bruennichi]|uniref:Peptidase aspartic putative domain-containing protein n=2 Tax=Argiope bruennichi TaxID=94029 RepID=A0A8T0F4D2_ARGBR|nr:hypothetical protein HNY73_007831 [Argiope bruennichi]
MIRLRNRDKEVCVRALLDDGSQRSYIEKNLAAELFLSPSGREIFSQGLFGGGISPASEHKRYMVNIESLNRKYSTPLSLLEQQKICSTLPRIHDRKLLSELASRGIKLTDVGRDSPPIRVLLGADILGSILTGRIEVLSSGVSAVETLLGWTILGLGKKKEVVNLVTLSLQNMDVPKMWDLEVLGITDPIEKIKESLLEEETLTHFKETIRICEDQSYEVALPWLAGHPAPRVTTTARGVTTTVPRAREITNTAPRVITTASEVTTTTSRVTTTAPRVTATAPGVTTNARGVTTTSSRVRSRWKLEL